MHPDNSPTSRLRSSSAVGGQSLARLQTAVGGEAVAGQLLFPFLAPPEGPDEIGRLGNYRVRRLLGKGGMGYVFLAEDVDLGRPVALKVMKPELDRDAAGDERFLREARAMAAIKHDSLVTVYQVGRERGAVYLAMELLEGRTLEDWLALERRPDVPSILAVAKGIAGGLAAIHRRGLIHRDLKPANLWMEEPGGRVKILDFGLARFVHDDAALTQSGMILGTPAFMSPEQARGETLDARSDLFSLGGVLYNLCTGTIPFDGKSTTAVLTALAVHTPCPVRQINPRIPSALSMLIAQLLEKKAEDRPPTAEAVLQRLEQIERGVPEPAPARQPVPTPPARESATLVLPEEKTRPPAGGRKKLVGTIVAAFVITFAVPLITSTVMRNTLPGAAHAMKGNQEVVYLKSFEPVQRENWPFIPPRKADGPPKKDPSEVVVQGRLSPRGIFMHPPPGFEGAASVTYSLGGEFERFQAEVTQNDGPPESDSPYTFAVYGDGKLLWKSRPVRRQADGQSCSVPVRGVDRLKIEVRAAGEPRGAHAVWVEPHLTK